MLRAFVAGEGASALERYKKACPKDPTSCAYAGAWLFEHGVNVERGAGEHVAWFRRACKAGSRYGCDRVAGSLPDRSPEAIAIYVDLCQRDYVPGCTGAAYILGQGTEAEQRRATELYVKACDLAHLDACWHAALDLAYRTDVSAEVQARARDKADAACTAGNGASCSILATIHRCGKGVPCNNVRADAYDKRAELLDPTPPPSSSAFPGGLSRIAKCNCQTPAPAR